MQIKRKAVEDNELQSIMWDPDGADEAELLTGSNDIVVYRNSPLDNVKSIQIVRSSVHQSVDVTREGDVITIVVTPEKGEARTYTITLADLTNDNATLSSVTGAKFDKAFAPAENNYVAEGLTMPILKFTKANQYQAVVFTHTADSAKMVVTSADKTTTNTYRFTLAAKSTAGTLDSLSINGQKFYQPKERIEIKARPELP